MGSALVQALSFYSCACACPLRVCDPKFVPTRVSGCSEDPRHHELHLPHGIYHDPAEPTCNTDHVGCLFEVKNWSQVLSLRIADLENSLTGAKQTGARECDCRIGRKFRQRCATRTICKTCSGLRNQISEASLARAAFLMKDHQTCARTKKPRWAVSEELCLSYSARAATDIVKKHQTSPSGDAG